MKRLLAGIMIGALISVVALTYTVASAQDGIAAYLRPLIVDVQQTVPVTADIVVPLNDGTTITTTVPLTVNVALQVSLSGIISNSVQLVEETKPVVEVIKPTSTPRQIEGNLTFAEVCVDAPKELTDVKLKQYHESLIGTEILWSGYIYDVIEEDNGTYTVEVSTLSREESTFFARSVQITGVSGEVAADLDVNQPISYSGTITAIEEFITNCNPVVIEYGSLTPQ